MRRFRLGTSTTLARGQARRELPTSVSPLFIVVTVGILVCLSAKISAAQQNRATDTVLRDEIDVRLISLDAVVTDRSNEPIADLEPDDFQLKVDGRKVKINDVARGEELRETITGRLTVVLLIDDRHLQKAHRDRTLVEITDALSAEMAVNPTWVSVATFSDRLDPLLAPTRDEGAFRAAIDRAIERDPPPSHLRTLQRDSINEVQTLLRNFAKSGSSYRLAQASTSSVATKLENYGKALSLDTMQTLRATDSLVEALSFVPGRKAILLLTDGIARTPLDLIAKTMYDRLSGDTRSISGEEMMAQSSTLTPHDRNTRPTGSDRADRSGVVRPLTQNDDGGAMAFMLASAELSHDHEFEQLAARANTHQVSFYPLKPPVLDASLTGLGEHTSDRGSISALTDVTVGLEYLASATGGLFFAADTGVTEFLARTREDLAAYYSLSFTPPETMKSSGIREMQLKVRRRKANLRYRASYVPISLQESLASRAWGTLLFGWEDNLHGLEVTADVGALEGQQHPVQMTLSLPIGELELVPYKKAFAGNFRVVYQLQRNDGGRLEPEHVTFAVSIPKADIEEAREHYFAVRTPLKLPVGRYEMSIGLWEENSGRTSYVLHHLEVGTSDSKVARRPTVDLATELAAP